MQIIQFETKKKQTFPLISMRDDWCDMDIFKNKFWNANYV